MNDVLLDKSEREAASDLGPGQRLRVAREAKGLPRNEVADKLHLAEDMVRALEADEYGKLPDPVFIKGYLRKYARLVGEPEAPLLAAYAQAVPVAVRQTRLAAAGIKQEIRSSHIMVRAISWLIVIGSLALLGVWLQGYFKEASQALWPGDEPVVASQEPADGYEPANADESAPAFMPESSWPAEEPVDQLEPASEQMPEAEVEIDSPTAEMAVTEAAAEASEPPAGELPASPEAEDLQPQAPVPQPAPAPAASQPAAAPAASAGEEVKAQPLAEEAVVVFEFEADCWVDVRDATGKYRILGNMSKGERRVLEGTPPYSVVLGNSRAVKIQVKGQPFDLGPYTQGNVARFRLDPDRPATP